MGDVPVAHFQEWLPGSQTNGGPAGAKDWLRVAAFCQGRLKTHPFAPVENAPPCS